jgi:hypothetical protein
VAADPSPKWYAYPLAVLVLPVAVLAFVAELAWHELMEFMVRTFDR